MSSDKVLPEIDDATAIEDADMAVAEVTVPLADHPLVKVIGEFGDFSDQEPLYAATGAAIVTGLVMRDARTIQAGTRMLAAHLLATAARGIVKRLVDRTRPDVAASTGVYRMGPGDHHEHGLNSFPSGHTAGALAVAMAFSREYPRQAPYALAAAGASGAAQIVRGSHFPSDVAAGAAIAVVAEIAIDRLVRLFARY